MYRPKPIDTSHVRLPRGITKLVERLAEHNHDVWAQQRMREGWKYGPRRDDKKKQHPDLVSYADLSEGEKSTTARRRESIKTVYELGIALSRPARRGQDVHACLKVDAEARCYTSDLCATAPL